jgi:Holliday junction resolvasome RuvABC endonuclease subunit
MAEGMVNSGAWDLTPRPGSVVGTRQGHLFWRLHELIWTCMLTGDEIVVAYEDVRRHRGTTAAHVYGALVGIIELVCGSFILPVRLVPIGVGTVKKFATGKGNASKEMMIDAAFCRWPSGGRAVYSSDEADARWIAECAWDRLTREAEIC